MLVQGLYFLIGLISLYFGADLSLESAEKIGKSWKMSPLLIGLFIVGFGTSLPEFFVSQLACFRGRYDMSIGNVIGSNVANIFLVLGVCGLFANLQTKNKQLMPQLMFHLLVTVLCGIFVYAGSISFLSLFVFSALFSIYFWMNFKGNKNEEESDCLEEENISVGIKEYSFLLLGFGMLYGGGEVLVYSGSNLGLLFGVSEFTISAILVAFGTSFPELVTSLIACRRKKDTDLIVGNIIGSNVFNICFVLGSVGIYQFNIVENYLYESLLLSLVSFIFVFMGRGGIPISRFVSIIFLLVYVGISTYWITYS